MFIPSCLEVLHLKAWRGKCQKNYGSENAKKCMGVENAKKCMGVLKMQKLYGKLAHGNNLYGVSKIQKKCVGVYISR